MYTGMVLVKSLAEEKLFIKLVNEFGYKVNLPRNFTPTETFKKYMEKNVFGIIGVVSDEDSNEAVFEVALPFQYINFICYMINKLRVEPIVKIEV